MNYKEYTITEFDPKEVSDEFLNEYFDFLDVTYRWYEKDDPLPDREQRFQYARDPYPHSQNYSWIIRDREDQIVASAGMGYIKESSPSYEGNKHTFRVSVSVLPDHRRKGIATFMAKHMIQRGIEYGKTVLQVGANQESGTSYIEKFLRGKVAHKGGESRLRLIKVDWDMLNSWIEEGQIKNPDTVLVFFEDCPEDMIESYMEIYTETMNQQPMGDMEWSYKGTPESRREDEESRKKQGVKWYTLITQEPDGRISGLTEMIFNPKRVFRIGQNLTGVRESNRGRGLGKWLKAEMLKRILDLHPSITYISTGNADSNAPMLSINKRMGFEKYMIWQVYKFDPQELLQKLNSARPD